MSSCDAHRGRVGGSELACCEANKRDEAAELGIGNARVVPAEQVLDFAAMTLAEELARVRASLTAHEAASFGAPCRRASRNS